MANIFIEPLVFQDGTGFITTPSNTEIFDDQTVLFLLVKL